MFEMMVRNFKTCHDVRNVNVEWFQVVNSKIRFDFCIQVQKYL